jgi:hypothetical protein
MDYRLIVGEENLLKEFLLDLVLNLDKAVASEQKRDFKKAQDFYSKAFEVFKVAFYVEGIEPYVKQLLGRIGNSLFSHNSSWQALVNFYSDPTRRPLFIKTVPKTCAEQTVYLRAFYLKQWEFFRKNVYKGVQYVKVKNLLEILPYWDKIEIILALGDTSCRVTTHIHVSDDEPTFMNEQLLRYIARLADSSIEDSATIRTELGQKILIRARDIELSNENNIIVINNHFMGGCKDKMNRLLVTRMNTKKYLDLKLPKIRAVMGSCASPALTKGICYIDDKPNLD